MPTQHSVRRQRSTTVSLASALCALTLAASACGTGDADDAVVDYTPVSTQDPTSAQQPTPAPTSIPTPAPTHETANNPGQLQFGDSIADVLPTAATSTESALVTVPGFRAVEWEELVDPNFSGEQIAEKYRDRLDAAKPGSPTVDSIYDEMKAEYDNASVNVALDGEDIQLAGFIAPLTYDGDAIIEFILVPYFGACIHVPAPPVNQTVMVSLAEGERLSLEDSWSAIWVAGTMTTTTTGTDIATAGYAISGAQFGVYDGY